MDWHLFHGGEGENVSNFEDIITFVIFLMIALPLLIILDSKYSSKESNPKIDKESEKRDIDKKC